MPLKGILSINEVNALPVDNLEWLFGNVVEYSPEAAVSVATKRPFLSIEDFKRAFDEYLDKLDNSEKELVLVKHSDLANKLIDAKLTMESENEQYDSFNILTVDERKILNNNNYLYKEKFRFPFILCMRKNNIETIVYELGSRLNNSKETELKNGIEEVKKISKLKIDELVWPDF